MLWPLGDILADQPVGVLVGAALPGVVRGREVEARLGRRLERRIAVELGPVVAGDGVHRVRLVLQDQRMARRLTSAVVRARSLPSTR